MKKWKEILLTVATAFYTWSAVLVALALTFTAVSSFSITSLREMAMAFVLLFPLRKLYGSSIPDLAFEWLEKNKIPALTALIVVTLINLIKISDFYHVFLGYYGFIHQSLSSVFLRSMLLYQDIFGTLVSDIIFGAATFYVEALLVYVLIKPVYLAVKHYRGERDGE